MEHSLAPRTTGAPDSRMTYVALAIIIALVLES